MPKANKTGIVYLIGAGPGDPGLITVKGKRLLDSCDVVIHDNLVSDELVATLAPEVIKHYVGKRAGKPCISQDVINDLMVSHARQGQRVARLKGSDPFIFGRGGEEAKHLTEHNIPYEVIPGVTSGIAAPAYAGIPVTDRSLASFVILVTGHKAREKIKSTVPWEWLAKARGGTIVIYMGVREIENIVGLLIDNGMNPETPSAAIERGTFPTQKITSAELKDLPATVKRDNILPPALFVIGEVVDLKDYIAWFKDKPLLGIRLMVTRASEQARELYEQLRDLGAEVQPYPTIGIRELNEPKGWDQFKRIDRKERWLLFTSETGVIHFMKQFFEYVGDIRGLGNFKIAAIGKGTAGYLKESGLSPDFIPETATGVDFAREMAQKYDLSEASVVRVRGTLAGDAIEKKLAEAGAEVVPLTVYKTYHPKWPDGFVERLMEHLPDGILFTSGSTVRGLYDNLPEDQVRTLTDHADIFSIGPATSKVLHKHGIEVTEEADPHNLNAMIERIITFYRDKKRG